MAICAKNIIEHFKYIYLVVDRIYRQGKDEKQGLSVTSKCKCNNFPPLAVLFVLIVCGVAFLPMMRECFTSPVKEVNSGSIYPPLNDHDGMDG